MTARHTPQGPGRHGHVGQRGSLPLALIVVILVGGLIVVLVSRTIATQNQVRFDQGFHGALPVADSGIDLAKFLLNDNAELTPDHDPPTCMQSDPLPASEFPIGCTTIEMERDIDGKPYTFTLTRETQRRWQVDSTGMDPDPEVERRLVAIFEETPLVDLALFADLFLDLGGGNQADSYTSTEAGWSEDPATWCTRRGFVVTNGDINFSGQANPDTCHEADGRTVDRLFFHEFPDGVDGVTGATPAGERCTQPMDHPNCIEREAAGEVWHKPETEEERFELEGLDENPFIAEALAYDGLCEAETLLASDLGGVLQPGELSFEVDTDLDVHLPGDLKGKKFHCYSELRFDEDTIVDSDADEPVIFIVQDLEIDGGGGPNAVHVNCGGSPGDRCVRGPIATGEGASTPQAGKLWIFVRDEIVLGHQSHVAGVLWGPEADCDGGAQADIYGSLICKELVQPTGGGWRFHYDDGLQDVSSGEFRLVGWSEEPRP